MVERFEALVARARQYAAQAKGTFELGEPLEDGEIDELADMFEPHFGRAHFPVPPSYRAFLKRFGFVWASGVEGRVLRLLSADEMVQDTADLVHVPAGVTYADTEISTNHLIAFADGDGAEARWCFSTADAEPGAELPVYYHHQDEPLAARSLDGKWVNVVGSRPDYPDFIGWLVAAVQRFGGVDDIYSTLGAAPLRIKAGQ